MSSAAAAAGSPSPPHQYPQEIQLKLYQAFIFSIPILFSIILFLLFYLFYLKRRSASSSPLLPRTTTNNLATTTITTTPNSDAGLKNELKNKMCTILFDEYMKTRDSLCCVCLGEFEVKEELLQVGSCKHMFHVDCIRHWLHNHSTCPLCRSPVFLSPNLIAKSDLQQYQPNNDQSHHHHHHQLVEPPLLPQQQQLQQHTIISTASESSSSGGSSSTNIC